MFEYSSLNLQDIFEAQKTIAKDIQQLQLMVLPHPRFVMLYERAEELNDCLTAGLRRVAGNESEHSSQQSEDVRQLADRLRLLLSNVYQKATTDLKAVEELVGYTQLPLILDARKKQVRALAADLAKALEHERPETIVSRFGPPLTAIISELKQLIAAVRKLNAWADPKVQAGCKTMAKVFGMMENSQDLAALWAEVQQNLQHKAYGHIKDSRLFDSQFYLDQLPDKGQGITDSLAHYLTHGQEYAPNSFFNPEYYRASYDDVRMLRYNPLEHFLRYGELMYSNPGPDFDALYYLENNDDVLDSGFPPFRHFLLHGLSEGRQPSSNAGAFFVKRYLKNTPVSLGFVGEPDASVQAGWDMVYSRCEAREGGRVTHISLEDWNGNEPGLDAVVISDAAIARLYGELLQNLAASGCRLLYMGAQPEKDLKGLLRQEELPLERVCAVTPDYEEFLRWQESEVPLKLRYYRFDEPDHATPFLDSLLNSLSSGDGFSLRRSGLWDADPDMGPRISVVSIIYKKSKEMLAFLEALNRQDLARDYEVVLVDDASPDDTVERVEQWLEEKRHSGLMNKFMTVRILRNENNLGNCSSRNRGVEAAKADVVLVADGDVVMNTSSLSEHLWAYRCGDCDAVIGFFRFNLGYSFVFHWLAACEVNPDIVRQHSMRSSEFALEKLHMRSLPNSIFTFVTRNTSFRKSAFDGDYFDEAFNYSSDKNSGYGEEDHEIAAKLYFNNKNIRFIESSICVHIRHADNSYNADKAIANLRNWNRLINTHPDLKLIDRQYFQWRTRDLLNKTSGKPDAPEVKTAQAYYTDPERSKVIVPPMAPLRILTCNWDVRYQYELFKMQHQFTMVADKGSPLGGKWGYGTCPLPHNAHFASLNDIDLSEYDFAILPFDRRVLFSGQDRGSWGESFREMLELTKGMPRTAVFHESLPTCLKREGNDEPSFEEQRAVLRELVRDIHVVCSSHQARKEWGFADSSIIWHGLSPQEFPDGTHERHCVTFARDVLDGSNAAEILVQRMKESLPDGYGIDSMDESSPHGGYVANTQEWAVAKFQGYAAHVGSYATHLTPFEAPAMPRQRAEAMLAGVIPITLRNDDVDKFIKNGVNGFAGDSAEELTEHMTWLLRNDEQRQKMSRNARLTAMDIFNIDHHVAAWSRTMLQLM